MALLIYTTPGDTGFDMRSLDMDGLIAGMTLSAFNPFVVQWSNATTGATVNILGDGLNPTVSGGVLTGLTGTQFTQLFAPNVTGADSALNIAGLTASVSGFFDLVQAKDWVGLAEFMRQGNDSIVGTKNDDTLLGGDGNDSFVSSAGRDIINGGAGNDTLLAMGGHDVMTGGKGADDFVFEVEPIENEAWWVKIRDFKSGVDRISVSDTAFNNVGFGGFDGAMMDASHFHIGRAATTVDQTIVYNRVKGLLFYDGDGSGSQADLVLLAKLGAGTILTFEDMWVV